MSRHHNTVDNILASAASLFAERSFGLTSTREIAARAGISLAKIYYYLHGKEQLLFLVAKRGLEHSIASFEKASANVNNPNEKLEIFIHNQLKCSTSCRAEAKVVIEEISKLSEPYLSEIRAMERRYTETCRTLLTNLARANGQELSCARSRILVSLLFGAINSVATNPNRREITQEIHRMFARAVTVSDSRPKTASRTE